MDLSHIYKLWNDFTIIGLTGRTASGCTQIADQLSKGFNNGFDFEKPLDIGWDNHRYKHNSY